MTTVATTVPPPVVTTTTPVPSTARAPVSSPRTTASPTMVDRAPASTTTVAPTTEAPQPRAAPAITASNESYEVEVVGQFRRFGAQDLTGYIRRRDLAGVSGEGPDGYGAASIAGWRGAFGRRCLASGGSSGNLSLPGEPAHLYAYGVVGLDATKVELRWDGGRRVVATLGNQTISEPVRWWIATYDTAGPDEIVATDAAGASWALRGTQLVGVFGQTGC